MWKEDPNRLKQMGKTGKDYLVSLGLDYKSVGSKLVESIKSTKPVKNELDKPKIYSKEYVKELRSRIVDSETLEEKLKHLHNSFEGETCYVLNCGPSLKHYSPDYLKEKLNDKLVLAVKMAHEYCPEVVDMHFFNCCNMPQPVDGTHYRYSDEVISIGSSNYPEGARWSKDQTTDIFLKIPIRTTVKNFLCHERNFDDYMLCNTTERPVGPGIMYETVLHTIAHLGVSNVVVLGWDLGGNPKSPMEFEHFYDNHDKIYNRGDMFGPEVEWALASMKHMHTWLQSHNINLYIASNISRLSLSIPRTRI